VVVDGTGQGARHTTRQGSVGRHEHGLDCGGSMEQATTATGGQQELGGLRLGCSGSHCCTTTGGRLRWWSGAAACI
jgi:hypothetical protein